jgi:N-acetyl-gamma-glutamyl-phosphate reductase
MDPVLSRYDRAMAPRIFIDGHVGTTGLRIRDWLEGRDDLEIAMLADDDRKRPEARRALQADCDLTVLCLPDDAARESAAWAAEDGGRILDASSAHRVHDDWVYGLPELTPDQRKRIADANLVSNPGCYPSAWLALVRPLADAALIDADAGLAIHAVSGYSGGGRGLIEKWEDPDGGLVGLPFEAPYALDRIHKHVPEMTRWSGLSRAPVFVPAVGAYRCGMRVQVPLPTTTLADGVTAKTIWEALDTRYRGEPFVRVRPIDEALEIDELYFDPRSCNDTNRMELHVVPNPAGHVLLIAVLDNLGKGAAGVAIQNLNLMLGLPETTGLPA